MKVDTIGPGAKKRADRPGSAVLLFAQVLILESKVHNHSVVRRHRAAPEECVDEMRVSKAIGLLTVWARSGWLLPVRYGAAQCIAKITKEP